MTACFDITKTTDIVPHTMLPKKNKQLMTYEEYINQVYKYDGESNPWTIKDCFGEQLHRKQRQIIKSLLRRGKNPDVEHIIYGESL